MTATGESCLGIEDPRCGGERASFGYYTFAGTTTPRGCCLNCIQRAIELGMNPVQAHGYLERVATKTLPPSVVGGVRA